MSLVRSKYDAAKRLFIAFIAEDEKATSQSLTLKEIADRIDHLNMIRNLFVAAEHYKFAKGYVKTLDNLINRYAVLQKELQEQDAQKISDEEFEALLNYIGNNNSPPLSPVSIGSSRSLCGDVKYYDRGCHSPGLFGSPSAGFWSGDEFDGVVQVVRCGTPDSFVDKLMVASPIRKKSF